VSEWNLVRLGDVTKVIDSLHVTPKYVENGYPIIRVQDIYEGLFDIQNPLYVTKDVYEKYTKKHKPKKGDILFTRVGANNGISSYVNTNVDFCIGQNTCILTEYADSVYSKYIYYIMISNIIKHQIQSMNTGSTHKTISLGNINNFEFYIPSYNEQKSIADTLSCLDEKIELNNRMNKTLEEMAQAIFKSWFVGFEPFQDGEYEDSEMGRIPKGWKVGKADDFFDIAIGKTPPRKEPQWFSKNKDDVKWVSISDMGNCGLYIFNTSEYLTREGIEKYNVKVVPIDTVLLSFKLTVGRVAITSQEMTTNEAIAHFKSNKNNINEFLYFYLKSFNYETLGNTSSIANAVNSKVIKSMIMLMPDDNTLDNFHNIINPLMFEIRKNQEQNQILTEIRDSLLQKLMSGEIRVSIEEV
jgi:type I restriction enzyme S subunit